MDAEPAAPVVADISLPPVTDPRRSESSEQPEALPEPVQADVAVVRRDYRTGALTAAVLALAVLLGWMVGRVGWSMAVNRAPAQAAITPDEAQAMVPVIPANSPATSRREEPPVPPRRLRPESPRRPSQLRSRKRRRPSRLGGLVVYEHGKVVFRMPPSRRPNLRLRPVWLDSGCDSKSGDPGRR